MLDAPFQLPPQWEQIRFGSTQGVILVVGGPDVGKSTFARYLVQRLAQEFSNSLAFIDGDPGQTSLGPPATMTLSIGGGQPLISASDPPQIGRLVRFFVGSTTPRGHMLSVLIGAGRLAGAAREAGVQTVVFDTSGLVEPSQGGIALKLAKIDLLQPVAVIAIQRESELEPLLMPLQRSQRTQVIRLKPSSSARRRDVSTRRSHRTEQFAEHFSNARQVQVDWTQLAVFPYPRFTLNRVLALEDRQGFTLALGVVIGIDRTNRQVTLLTPMPSLQGVASLHLGDLSLDPVTFQDELLG